MLSSSFLGLKLYQLPAEDKRVKKDGTPRNPKKIGKLHYPVFSSDGTRVVGFMLRLPDIAGMIKQPDRFVARDAIGVSGDYLVVKDPKTAFDTQAVKRLGIDLDTCLIWTGMDVVTASGKNVGYCSDAQFNGKTGDVEHFVLVESGASNALVGHREIPVSYLRGYREGAMIVSDEVLELGFSGGAAAKAAEVSVKAAAKASEATAKAKVQVKKGARALDEHGSKALDKGSRALGKQIGKTKGMFGSFVSEYKKASGSAGKPSSGSGKAPGAQTRKNKS